MTDETIRLTKYSHGAGCGCKISPALLEQMLARNLAMPDSDRLLVGNDAHDDAAVYDLGDGTAIVSTTDFFMPIVDDPTTFGRIAATNAISDVYAMGGTPLLAIAILGWPIDRLPAAVAADVLSGGRAACGEAGIPLAGGHSIDSPEPIFGLAVTGRVALDHLKRNSTARPGDLLYLTKTLGVGILTTAEKKGLLREEDRGRAAEQMVRLNRIGEELGRISGVHAMTDVTGFGFLGHLDEMCAGNGLCAEVRFDAIPRMAGLEWYVQQECVPGGTHRNWASYGERIALDDDLVRAILCDPQTSGGLLLAVSPDAQREVELLLSRSGLEAFARPFGTLRASAGPHAIVIR